jgi:hypothetical protein
VVIYSKIYILCKCRIGLLPKLQESNIRQQQIIDSTPVKFEILQDNKIKMIQGAQKTLIEYDLEKKTEKRTVIKE